MLVGNTDYLYDKKSSFLSMEKDFSIIITKMLEDEQLKKLLYYKTDDCLLRPNLTQEETFSLIGKHIRIVPKIEKTDEQISYVIISFDNFTPNATNPQFRDNIITFDILCNFDLWNMGDFKLRPYKIAGRIDARLNNQKLSGIGTLQFLGANNLIINDQIAGITLMYSAIHGGEDTNE